MDRYEITARPGHPDQYAIRLNGKPLTTPNGGERWFLTKRGAKLTIAHERRLRRAA